MKKKDFLKPQFKFLAALFRNKTWLYSFFFLVSISLFFLPNLIKDALIIIFYIIPLFCTKDYLIRVCLLLVAIHSIVRFFNEYILIH